MTYHDRMKSALEPVLDQYFPKDWKQDNRRAGALVLVATALVEARNADKHFIDMGFEELQKAEKRGRDMAVDYILKDPDILSLNRESILVAIRKANL